MEVAHRIDRHAVVRGSVVGVDALGDLRSPVADELRAEQQPGVGVAGDADPEGLRAALRCDHRPVDGVRSAGDVAGTRA